MTYLAKNDELPNFSWCLPPQLDWVRLYVGDVKIPDLEGRGAHSTLEGTPPGYSFIKIESSAEVTLENITNDFLDSGDTATTPNQLHSIDIPKGKFCYRKKKFQSHWDIYPIRKCSLVLANALSSVCLTSANISSHISINTSLRTTIMNNHCAYVSWQCWWSHLFMLPLTSLSS